jgi:hypothetical protein
MKRTSLTMFLKVGTHLPKQQSMEGDLHYLIVSYQTPLPSNLKSGMHFLGIVKATTLRLFVHHLKPILCAAAALTLHPTLPPIQESPALVFQSRHVRAPSLAPGPLSTL